MQKHQAEVSLFIDPDIHQIEVAAKTGAEAIELHTGCYADADNEIDRQKELERIRQAAAYAANLNLIVNAGHGLHYHNVQAVAAIKVLNELNIGHAIISRALFGGLKEAVRDMKSLMQEARHYASD